MLEVWSGDNGESGHRAWLHTTLHGNTSNQWFVLFATVKSHAPKNRQIQNYSFLEFQDQIKEMEKGC